MPSANPARATEHFVTLFDSNFLPAGLCLYRSLAQHVSPFCLWILCADRDVEKKLIHLDFENVRLIPLRDVENERLRGAKRNRSAIEYYWTLTPFTPQFVMAREPGIERVTYIDADLFFFDNPLSLFEEFEQSGADVLITEHAYAPEYDQTATSGKYCVQFMTFRNTPGGRSVMHWWQERCIEWCYARLEGGKFGDQKYLDDWPERFAGKVHVLSQKDRALGPWNSAWFQTQPGSRDPVFFHFHGFRIISQNKMLWYRGYEVGARAHRYYGQYADAMRSAMSEIARRWGEYPILPEPRTLKRWIARLWYGIRGRLHYEPYRLPES